MGYRADALPLQSAVCHAFPGRRRHRDRRGRPGLDGHRRPSHPRPTRDCRGRSTVAAPGFHALREHAPRADVLAVDAPPWWNRCADAEINDDLLEVDAAPASAPDLPATLGGVNHRLAEDYYGNPVPGPAPWDCGSAVDGRPRPWDTTGSPHLTPSEAE